MITSKTTSALVKERGAKVNGQVNQKGGYLESSGKKYITLFGFLLGGQLVEEDNQVSAGILMEGEIGVNIKMELLGMRGKNGRKLPPPRGPLGGGKRQVPKEGGERLPQKEVRKKDIRGERKETERKTASGVAKPKSKKGSACGRMASKGKDDNR